MRIHSAQTDSLGLELTVWGTYRLAGDTVSVWEGKRLGEVQQASGDLECRHGRL